MVFKLGGEGCKGHCTAVVRDRVLKREKGDSYL